MDRHFLSKIIFLTIFCVPVVSWGNCPLGDFFEKKQDINRMLLSWQMCAVQYNDDISQYKLGQAYEKGAYGVEKDELQMLYYYQLAAESGHAEAQTHLAELFMSFDKNPQKREKLLDYQKKIKPKTENTKGFKGNFMHPYALLMLSSETPDKKWYYPSSVKMTPARTLSLLKAYKISDENKKKAMQEASKWKSRKLLETAKEVVPTEKYDALAKQLKNSSTQTLAMTEIKKYMDEYIQRKKKLYQEK